MKNYLIFTLVLVSLILMSCNSALNITSGRYKEKNGNAVFMINPNNTFSYSSGEIPEKFSNGSWMQYENTIFINSTVQNKNAEVKESENSQPKFNDIKSDTGSFATIDGNNANMNLRGPDSLLIYRIFTNTALKFKRRSIYFTDPEKANADIKYKLKDGKKSIIKSIKKKNLHKNIEETK